jgi:hypothetical protein
VPVRLQVVPAPPLPSHRHRQTTALVCPLLFINIHKEDGLRMTGTERKRAWRLRNPEANRTAEPERAQARRDGYWDGASLGVAPRLCASAESYDRYESTLARMRQRLFWPRFGAGAHRLTSEEFKARSARVFADARQAILAQC